MKIMPGLMYGSRHLPGALFHFLAILSFHRRVAKRLMWRGSPAIWTWSIFRRCSFLRGHRSTTPKWCVGVCRGPARVWVSGLAHPWYSTEHDTAQKKKKKKCQRGCQQRQAAPLPRPVQPRVLAVDFSRVWVAGRSTWGGKGQEKCLDHAPVPCEPMSALQHRSRYCLCCASPHLPSWFAGWKD